MPRDLQIRLPFVVSNDVSQKGKGISSMDKRLLRFSITTFILAMLTPAASMSQAQDVTIRTPEQIRRALSSCPPPTKLTDRTRAACDNTSEVDFEREGTPSARVENAHDTLESEKPSEVPSAKLAQLDAATQSPSDCVDLALPAISFIVGRSTLSADDATTAQLTFIAESLRTRTPRTVIRFVGHSDAHPWKKASVDESKAKNLQLSQARAAQVLAKVSSLPGHPIDGAFVLSASGVGSAQPIDGTNLNAPINRAVRLLGCFR